MPLESESCGTKADLRFEWGRVEDLFLLGVSSSWHGGYSRAGKWGLFSRHNFRIKKETNWSPYQGFPKTELLPADFSCISSLRRSQLPKPRSPWGKSSGKEKNLGLNKDQKNSSPVVCHRRASHSEFNKGSTWKTKRLSGIRAAKAFLKHSLNLKDGSKVPKSSIKLTFK